MSENEKLTQKELMKKFLEDKKNKNNQEGQKFLREKNASSKSTSKAKRSYNGGGFFDK